MLYSSIPDLAGQGDSLTQIEPMREDIYEKYQTALEEEQRKGAFKGEYTTAPCTVAIRQYNTAH